MTNIDPGHHCQSLRLFQRISVEDARQRWTVDAERGVLVRVDGSDEQDIFFGGSGPYMKVRLRWIHKNSTEYLHRLIFAIVSGEWVSIVDHIDQNKLNNRPDNLRPATVAMNAINSRRVGDARNIRWSSPDRAWKVSMFGNGQIYEATANSVEDARRIRQELREQRHRDLWADLQEQDRRAKEERDKMLGWIIPDEKLFGPRKWDKTPKPKPDKWPTVSPNRRRLG